MFEKTAGFESRVKIRIRKELIMFAVNLAAAWRSRGAGDRIEKIGVLSECFNQRGFACARWRGDDEKNSAAAKRRDIGFRKSSTLTSDGDSVRRQGCHVGKAKHLWFNERAEKTDLRFCSRDSRDQNDTLDCHLGCFTQGFEPAPGSFPVRLCMR